MTFHTWVNSEGHFIVGVHQPFFKAANQREGDFTGELGRLADGRPIDNRRNFPEEDIEVDDTDWIFEIPNPLSFRGATYIKKDWADAKAADPSSIKLPPPPEMSLSTSLAEIIGSPDPKEINRAFSTLPDPMLLAAATASTDPNDLVILARLSCAFLEDKDKRPIGLIYEEDRDGRLRAKIDNHPLFEAVANNPSLPDPYKVAMVLRPGTQGGSEIVGEARSEEKASHVFEYLRRNSYIAWGHYASNMADDSVRYSVAELTQADITGLRRLYYQGPIFASPQNWALPPHLLESR